MTPDDLEPLDPDESALRTLDDQARAAAEGLRRATAVAPPPLRSQRVGIRPGATIEVGHPTFTLGGPRVRKSRIIVALAVAALIATAVAVVTRSRTSHQSPATTVTTAPPATTEAPTTVCI